MKIYKGILFCLVIKLISFLILAEDVSTEQMAFKCDLWIGPSTIPNAGRGIFTGKKLEKGDLIEEAVCIPLKYYDILSTPLINYIYGSDDENYVLLMLGAGSFLNHHDIRRNAHHVWSDHDVQNVSDPLVHYMPYSNFTKTTFETIEDINSGDEIFDSYGDDWFNDGTRGEFDVVDQSNHSVSIDVSNYEKVCLSTVFVDTSTIPTAGFGLFASKSFQAGERITISPAVILSKDAIESTAETSTLMNYVMSDESLPIGILPFGLPAIINHAIQPNIGMRWFNWSIFNKVEDSEVLVHPLSSALNLTKIFSSSLEEILNLPYVPLDIEYYALSPIAEGEELFIDYGDRWENSWREYVDLQYEMEEKKYREPTCDLSSNNHHQCVQEEEIILFRDYIQLPTSLTIPEHWRTQPSE